MSKYRTEISGAYPNPPNFANDGMPVAKPTIDPITENMQQVSDEASTDYIDLLHIGTHTFHRQHLNYGPSAVRDYGSGEYGPMGGNPSPTQNTNPTGNNNQGNGITNKQLLNAIRNNRNRFGSRSGGRLQGPGSINVPKLGNVPASQATPMNPIVLILILGALGIGGYLLYHKLHKAKHEEHEMHKQEHHE